MNDNYLLECNEARKLYNDVKSLPVCDYHCHLSPREIYEDKPFDDIADIWLSGDHYKWRLMRAAGIDERFITGNASPSERFRAYADAVGRSPGNPLYHWSHMELSRYFGIDLALCAQNADEIYRRANEYIKSTAMSPRKLIERSGVTHIATTDDPADNLQYHALLREQHYSVAVLPSFRTDRLLQCRASDYSDYLKKLGDAANIRITDLESLLSAIAARLDYFVANGCRLTDVGIPDFPCRISDKDEAQRYFSGILSGKPEGDYSGWLGYMYTQLAKMYRDRSLVMQLHLCVYRNANSALYSTLGADCGVDVTGDTISGSDIIRLLDEINKSGMPRTIIYTLNESMAQQLCSIIGAFPGVTAGAAWWFCDTRRGIERQLTAIAEQLSLGSFTGMLTDSRSFLSYARHDYFRRILCNLVGGYVRRGECDKSAALAVCRKVCYENALDLMKT